MRFAVVALLALAVGCRSEVAPRKTRAGDAPIRAVATTGMIGDLVREIGGPEVQVADLFPPGVDPHTHRASLADLQALNAADIIFYNGLHLEGKMGAVLERLGDKIPSIAVGDVLQSTPVPADAPAIYQAGWLLKDDEHPDPHVWFDVALWSKLADVVAERLADYDLAHASEYRRRAGEYRDRLLRLDAEVRSKLAAIPKSARVLITSHDAFRYFGRAYDVEVRGIQGVSTESEASVGHIADLVDFLSRAKVKAVFVESSVSPRNMQALIEGCQARGHAVKLGGELFSDAMGPPGTPEARYEGMIRHNVQTIVEALQ